MLSIGDIYTLDRIGSSFGLACLLSWPILAFLAPIFAFYVVTIVQRRRFLLGHVLYMVTIACVGPEFWWVGVFLHEDRGLQEDE